MNFYLGATDLSWFNFLKTKSTEDVNFWQPSGVWNYKGLSQGEPFLFKLKKPYHVIGGIGFFLSFTHLPINVAWDVFEEKMVVQHFKNLSKSSKNIERIKKMITQLLVVLYYRMRFSSKKRIGLMLPVSKVRQELFKANPILFIRTMVGDYWIKLI